MDDTIFGINLAAKTTKPLNNLFRAAKSVSEGNYDIELKSDKNEDFRNLNLIFNYTNNSCRLFTHSLLFLLHILPLNFSTVCQNSSNVILMKSQNS